MKLVLVQLPLLLLFASRVSRAGYDQQGILQLLITENTHFRWLSQFQKRNNDDKDMEHICEAIIWDESCNNGLLQTLSRLHMYQQCNYQEVKMLQKMCRVNSKGVLCRSINFKLVAGIENHCLDTNSSCSAECRNVLLSTRDELNCCIVTFFNDTRYNSTNYFTYSLWSRCGVEPVIEECPPSPITFEPTMMDPICNNQDGLSQLINRHLCKHQYLDPLKDRLLSVKKCQHYATKLVDNECKVNRFGVYCGMKLRHRFDEASTNCADTSTCDPHCVETLNRIVNTVGCCFNEAYNNTNDIRPDWLGYEFWTKCNLKSPGLCEQKLIDDEETSTLGSEVNTSESNPFPCPSQLSSIIIAVTAIACSALVTVIIIVISAILLSASKKGPGLEKQSPRQTEHVHGEEEKETLLNPESETQI